jgi:predicted double-glycine peptidase
MRSSRAAFCKLRLCLVLLTSLLLLACASTTPQTDALDKTLLGLPEVANVSSVPFVEQAANECGPASLAMVLQWLGQPVTVEDLVATAMTPSANGTYQSDLVSAARRYGFTAIPIEGMKPLLQELGAAHPVIVFENLAFASYPQWHYAVTHGYDLNRKVIHMHSGKEKNKIWSLKRFERSWKLADYWGLVILPPGELSESADEIAHLKAAAALEELSNLEAATKSYKAILYRWPTSSAAQIGLANIAYKNKDYKSTVKILREALMTSPDSEPIKHNLKIAEASLRTANTKK